MAALDAVNTFTCDRRSGRRRGTVRAGPKPQNAKILIIDPAAARRWHILQCLVDIAGTIVEASSTSEGLSILGRQPIDLILLDLRAPEIGAANFCREVRNSASHEVPADLRLGGIGQSGRGSGRHRSGRQRISGGAVARSGVACSRAEQRCATRKWSIRWTIRNRCCFRWQNLWKIAIPISACIASGFLLWRRRWASLWNCRAHDIQTLQRGGYLHDIGKISIPDRILFKPGPLTPDEWELMKSHTLRGEKICAGIKSLTSVLPIVRSHHERWDGLGYPDGLRGDQIPMLARILQLADIYDALTTVRPYKAAFTPEEALSIIMEETGKGWRDPRLVRVFADLIPMFRGCSPPGSFTPFLERFGAFGGIVPQRCSPVRCGKSRNQLRSVVGESKSPSRAV